eukprot:Gb_13475 [translate_table: standard]
MRRSNSTIYVGNLPGDVRESEIEDLFYKNSDMFSNMVLLESVAYVASGLKYGRIIDIDLKLPPRPPGYCFIEVFPQNCSFLKPLIALCQFDDRRDAEDAIRGRDGYKFDGHRLRVEIAHGGVRSSSIDTYGSYSSGGRSYKRTGYRGVFLSAVIVHGLPSSASWQDLKDHMRRAGDVCFAEVFRRSGGAVGIVDYTSYEDMKYAFSPLEIRKLDDSEFRNPFSRSYLRKIEDTGVVILEVAVTVAVQAMTIIDEAIVGAVTLEVTRAAPVIVGVIVMILRAIDEVVLEANLFIHNHCRDPSQTLRHIHTLVHFPDHNQDQGLLFPCRRSISASCSHSYSGSPLHQGKVQSPSQGPGVRTLSPRSEDDDASPSQASPDSDAD